MTVPGWASRFPDAHPVSLTWFSPSVAALSAIPAEDLPEIYALSFWIALDASAPELTIGYNTEAQVAAAKASDSAEARWNFAYWLQNELLLISEPMPAADFEPACVALARRLHADGVIERLFGRAIPVIVHHLEDDDHVTAMTTAANPPGLTAAFATWSQEP